MAKTGRELLETLAPGVREKFMNNLKEEHNNIEEFLDTTFVNIEDLISSGFTWASTPEGHPYWLKIAYGKVEDESESESEMKITITKEGVQFDQGTRFDYIASLGMALTGMFEDMRKDSVDAEQIDKLFEATLETIKTVYNEEK